MVMFLVPCLAVQLPPEWAVVAAKQAEIADIRASFEVKHGVPGTDGRLGKLHVAKSGRLAYHHAAGVCRNEFPFQKPIGDGWRFESFDLSERQTRVESRPDDMSYPSHYQSYAQPPFADPNHGFMLYAVPNIRYRLAEKGAALAFVGNETIDGRNCARFDLKTVQSTRKLWFDLDRNGHLAKAELWNRQDDGERLYQRQHSTTFAEFRGKLGGPPVWVPDSAVLDGFTSLRLLPNGDADIAYHSAAQSRVLMRLLPETVEVNTGLDPKSLAVPHGPANPAAMPAAGGAQMPPKPPVAPASVPPVPTNDLKERRGSLPNRR